MPYVLCFLFGVLVGSWALIRLSRFVGSWKTLASWRVCLCDDCGGEIVAEHDMPWGTGVVVHRLTPACAAHLRARLQAGDLPAQATREGEKTT